MKILIELHLDGYDTEKEANEAALEFVREQLDFSASYVNILWHENMPVVELKKKLRL